MSTWLEEDTSSNVVIGWLKGPETLRADPKAVEDKRNVGKQVKQRADPVELCKLGVESFHLCGDLVVRELVDVTDTRVSNILRARCTPSSLPSLACGA